MKNHWISLAALLALILTSCGIPEADVQNQGSAPSSQGTLSSPPVDSQPPPTNQPDMPPPSTADTSDVQLPEMGSAPPAPRKIVEKAKADLVKQFGVDADQIRVRESRAVVWPDASLGCPQPDMVYAQVITPGYWILLEAEGRQYPYHTDQNEQIILCTRDSSDPNSLPLIPVNPDEIDDGQPWVPVD